MAKPKRKIVTMLVTVSAPEGLNVRRVRQEVRATLEGYGGYSSLYVARGEERSLTEDGGVKVRKVGPA